MATIKDIAKFSGVSIGTVDRVIHNRGYVSSDTEKKVKQVIKELNYSPNIHARQLKLAKKYTFGILMPQLHQDAHYWERPALGMRQAGEELKANDIELNFFHFDRHSERSFFDKCSEILNQEFDGLLIAPILFNPANKLICEISDKVPYVFFDSDLPDTNRMTFIGQDPMKSGRLAGKLMNMLVDDDGDIAIIRVLPEDYHINQRIDGFRSYFENNKLHNKILVYEWQENENLSSINAILKTIIENKNLQGIFVTNALTYLAASYVDLLELKNKIRIIGYDLIKENLAYLENSVIDFLISQSPITQGYQGIQSLYKKIVLNQQIEEKIMMPINIITEENIQFYKYASINLK